MYSWMTPNWWFFGFPLTQFGPLGLPQLRGLALNPEQASTEANPKVDRSLSIALQADSQAPWSPLRLRV